MPDVDERPPVVVSPTMLRGWELPRGGGKDDRGSVVVVGGASSLPGAVLLAGTAALRAGAGRLQLAVASPVATALAVAVPEAMVLSLPASDAGSVEPWSAGVVLEATAFTDVYLVGPGLDDEERCTDLLASLLPQLRPEASVVLDAYALRALAARPALADAVRGRLVLTPNSSEAAALLDSAGSDSDGSDSDCSDSDDADVARRLARRFDATVSLGGTIAAADGRAWTVQAGSSGLGTSGSGDVLAGLIAGVLARTGDGPQAACWGTHVHATCGERLSARVGHVGFLARELLDEAPRVLLELGAG